MKFDQDLRKDLIAFLVFSIILLGLIWISFYKADLVIILRTLLAIELFIIPGLLLTYLLKLDVDYIGRYALSGAVGLAGVGIISYYLGIFFRIRANLYFPYLFIGVILLEAGILIYRKLSSSDT